MNRSRIAIAIGVFIALFVGVVALYIFGAFDSRTAVTVTFPSGIEVVDVTGEEVTEAVEESSDTIRLDPGEYIYTLRGENIEPLARELVVGSSNQDLSITYAPYTTAYLATLYQDIEEEREEQITQEVLENVDGYQIGRVALYDRGQLLAAALVPDEFDQANPAGVYIAVYVRQEDEWNQIRQPELYRTTTNTPGVPVEVLDSINELINN